MTTPNIPRDAPSKSNEVLPRAIGAESNPTPATARPTPTIEAAIKPTSFNFKLCTAFDITATPREIERHIIDNVLTPLLIGLDSLVKPINVELNNQITPFIRRAPTIAGIAKTAIPVSTSEVRSIEPHPASISFIALEPLLICFLFSSSLRNTLKRPPPFLPPRNTFSIAFSPILAGMEMRAIFDSFFITSIDELAKLMVSSISSLSLKLLKTSFNLSIILPRCLILSFPKMKSFNLISLRLFITLIDCERSMFLLLFLWKFSDVNLLSLPLLSPFLFFSPTSSFSLDLDDFSICPSILLNILEIGLVLLRTFAFDWLLDFFDRTLFRLFCFCALSIF